MDYALDLGCVVLVVMAAAVLHQPGRILSREAGLVMIHGYFVLLSFRNQFKWQMLSGLDAVGEAQTVVQVLKYEAWREDLAEMDIAVVLVTDDLVAGSFALDADDHARLKFHRLHHLLHLHHLP